MALQHQHGIHTIVQPGAGFTLSKLTVLLGDNATGKTATCEWICGLFDPVRLERWRKPGTEIKYRIKYFCPDEMDIGFCLDKNAKLHYSVNGIDTSFNPIRYNVIYPKEDLQRYPLDEQKRCDLKHLARVFSLDESVIESVAIEINRFPHSKAKNLEFVTEEDNYRLCLNLEGTVPGLSFGALSGGEQETVLLEFATAVARISSRHTPTLLVLDGFISLFYEGWFEYFSHHFLDPANQFQTLLTIPQQDLDLNNLRWNGWEVVQLSGKPPNVQFE
jgi:hypothetical protein